MYFHNLGGGINISGNWGGRGGGGAGGGGAGGGGGETEDNSEKYERIAEEELNKEPKPRRRVFISFRHTDKNEVNLLRGRVKNERTDLDFIDMSLKIPFNSENATYIQSGIKKRIEGSSVTVVYVSDTTHQSEWVNWEIGESIRQNKGVVVIDARSNPSVRMPAAITENNNKVTVVPNKDKEIMSAIDRAAEGR